MKSGIYLIECRGHKYIGLSKNIKSRWSDHKSKLSKNVHTNPYMQGLWKKYKNEFTFFVLEYCDIELLSMRESYWIKIMNTITPNGMNLSTGGEAPKFSDKTKEMMSKSHPDCTGNRNSNFRNFRKSKNSSYKYYGVQKYKHSRNGNFYWKVYLTISRKYVYIGNSTSEIDAAKLYNSYIISNKIDRPLNKINEDNFK